MRLGLVQAHLAKGGKTILKGGKFYEKGGKKGKRFHCSNTHAEKPGDKNCMH